jgi:hypothetical protein
MIYYFGKRYMYHQDNVIYYGTLQTTTEHYVVLCSKIQPTDDIHFLDRERLGEAVQLVV